MVEEQKPSKIKYIGAWFLAGLLSKILQKISDAVLSNTLVTDMNDLNVYFLVGALLTIPILSGSFILVYKLFKTLNIKKVMMYIYVLGGLGTLLNFSVVTGIYSNMNVDLTIFYVSYIGAFVVSVYLIRSYFIKDPERWY